MEFDAVYFADELQRIVPGITEEQIEAVEQIFIRLHSDVSPLLAEEEV